MSHFIKPTLNDDSEISRMVEGLLELIQQPRDESTLLKEARKRFDGRSAIRLLDWIKKSARPLPPQLLRLAQYLAFTARPITTEPNTANYAWAGSTLRQLLHTEHPVAETWSFFSGPSKPARIADTTALGGITMEDLVTKLPEVLGPQGADPDQHDQKYFFVKFLDPSDFPPFAYVGFNPIAVAAVRSRLEQQRARPFASDETFAETFRAYVADLLWQDRQAVEALAGLLQPQVTSEVLFTQLKAAYKSWAIAQAKTDWTEHRHLEVGAFVLNDQRDEALAFLERQRTVRHELIQLLHRIDFVEDRAILIESPTLHAIAGLSLQIHPRASDNFHPKDELWIYKPIANAQGQRLGWILVEPQRTFDKTESGADFFTPFAWKDGRLGFRKTITRASLKEFVTLMDATPRPQADYVRQAHPIELRGGSTCGAAHWFRLVEEPRWPYFFVRELRFDGPGEATMPLGHQSFIELHATLGEIDVTLLRQQEAPCTVTVTPARAVFLPASLPYETIRYQTKGPAHLQFFSRQGPIPSGQRHA